MTFKEEITVGIDCQMKHLYGVMGCFALSTQFATELQISLSIKSGV